MALSPNTKTVASGDSLRAFFVALETLLWIPPHKPLSEEAVTKIVTALSGNLVSPFSNKTNE